MAEIAQPAPKPGVRSPRWLLVPLVGFAIVALTVGLFARYHDHAKGTYFQLFFSDPIHMKAWLATAAVFLALCQLMTAAWIFRKLPWPRPKWVPPFHRWTGRFALIATLPIAYHCIFRLGFQTYSARVLAHSLAGTAVYGAFAAKISIVRLHRFPWWVLPAAGGFLFAALIGVWYSSALWLFHALGAGI